VTKRTRAEVYELLVPLIGTASYAFPPTGTCSEHPEGGRIRLEVAWVGASNNAVAEYAYHFDVCAVCHRKLQEVVVNAKAEVVLPHVDVVAELEEGE
jgi:hypothetical protein